MGGGGIHLCAEMQPGVAGCSGCTLISRWSWCLICMALFVLFLVYICMWWAWWSVRTEHAPRLRSSRSSSVYGECIRGVQQEHSNAETPPHIPIFFFLLDMWPMFVRFAHKLRSQFCRISNYSYRSFLRVCLYCAGLPFVIEYYDFVVSSCTDFTTSGCRFCPVIWPFGWTEAVTAVLTGQKCAQLCP